MWWSLAAHLVAAGIGGAAYWQTRVNGAGSAAADILTATVAYGDIDETVSASGSVQPLSYVDVGSQVSGQIKALHFALGDHVNKGDLVAEIDPQDYQIEIGAQTAAIDDLKAQLAEKQASQLLNQQNVVRQKQLVAIGSRSAGNEDLQSAEADVAVGTATLASLQAQIRKAEFTLQKDQYNLAHTKIYAPLSGTVSVVDAQEGETLNANQSTPTILRISDLDTVTIKAEVSEADVPKLKTGMAARFTTLGEPDRPVTGKLRMIEPTPETTNNVVLYYALFDVPNEDGRLRIDMTTEVFFEVASARHVLTVPLSALGPVKDGKATVKVLEPGGRVVERTVGVGLADRSNAEITKGLSEGETVVIATAKPQGASGGFGGGMPPPM